MCRNLEFSKREKCFTAKADFSGTVFLKTNLWELLDARKLHIFEINVKFRFF